MAQKQPALLKADDPVVKQALGNMPVGFSRADFVTALSSSLGVTVDSEQARQLLQTLKRRAVISYDPITKRWANIKASSQPSQTAATLPLLPSNQPSSFPSPPSGQGHASGGVFTWVQSLLHGSIAYLACVAAILALVAINASFAWNLGEEDGFRYPLVMGLMACDLIRPLLIARGLTDFARWHVVRGSLAFIIALSLAPLSILSSTSVISASLFLGVEQNGGIVIELDQGTIATTNALLGANDHCGHDLALLDLAPGNCFLNSDFNNVTNTGIATV